MEFNRFKNFFLLCANQGCMHLINTSFEFTMTDKKGRKYKNKFSLCYDCTDELLKELNGKVHFDCEN